MKAQWQYVETKYTNINLISGDNIEGWFDMYVCTGCGCLCVCSGPNPKNPNYPKHPTYCTKEYLVKPPKESLWKILNP
jgi:hypothetical protein